MSWVSTGPKSGDFTPALKRGVFRPEPCWKAGTVCVYNDNCVYSVPKCSTVIRILTSSNIFGIPTSISTIFNHRYEKNWDKPNKTKLLQGAMERAGRLDLAERLRCLHWGHQKLSQRVELPSAFPFLITVHKTMRNKDALQKINDLNHKHL